METTITERISANPNPRSWRGRLHILFSWAWGKNFNREAALDSGKNVFAVLGVGSVLANLAVMSWPLAIIGGALVSAVWYADYLRHF